MPVLNNSKEINMRRNKNNQLFLWVSETRYCYSVKLCILSQNNDSVTVFDRILCFWKNFLCQIHNRLWRRICNTGNDLIQQKSLFAQK